mmetsp:Transcript_43129/g.90600  ORF Transcript_43129/g.90600 Transcript_43129/m.90600 type:complete len:80 (-) Transcript_43129:121-360(-)
MHFCWSAFCWSATATYYFCVWKVEGAIYATADAAQLLDCSDCYCAIIERLLLAAAIAVGPGLFVVAIEGILLPVPARLW